MAYVNRGVGIGLAIFIMLAPCLLAAETNTASLHDCAGVKLTCGSWAAKDKNTCRTCQQAQCKTENGKDMLAGNKNSDPVLRWSRRSTSGQEVIILPSQLFTPAAINSRVQHDLSTVIENAKPLP